MSQGLNSVVGIIFQNSYGYHVDSSRLGDVGSMHFIPFLSTDLKLSVPPLISNSIRGIPDEGDTYEGPRQSEGSIDTEANPLALGALLKTCMVHSVTAVGSAFQHTFMPRVNDFDENCVQYPVTGYEYLDTGSAMMYPDLNGNVMTLSINNGEFLMAKVDFVGGNFVQHAPQAASFPTGKLWTWDTGSLSVDGAGIDEIASMSIAMNESLESMHTLNNSKYPSRIKRTGFRTVEVDGTVKFDNQTEYQQFLSQSERELVFTFTGNVQVASGYYETVEIVLPTMRYETFEPSAGGPGEIEASIKAKGKYSVNSGTAMRITIVNTQPTY